MCFTPPPSDRASTIVTPFRRNHCKAVPYHARGASGIDAEFPSRGVLVLRDLEELPRWVRQGWKRTRVQDGTIVQVVGGGGATALTELLAVKLEAKRFAPFPVGKYQPQRILGTGGFGVAFLCGHKVAGLERSRWKGLATLERSGNAGKVWQRWKGLATLERSGNAGKVWQEMGCPVASLPDYSRFGSGMHFGKKQDVGPA
jgi:hypothetical protein